MNAEILTSMRESLFQCALTGSERIAEDPRFSRALAELGNHRGEAKVLEELARRGEQLLLPAEERGAQILDLLALLDAVLLTQSKAAGSGDEVLLEEAVQKEAIPELYYRQESYRSLESLRLALTESGKGRMEVLKAARESKRPYLEDLRLRPLFLRALGDRYAEFADAVETWIREERPQSMLSLLRHAFAPEQKERLQCRYFTLIDALSGGESESFYTDVIARSQGELKETAIAALGKHPEFYGTLLSLEKTEKNKAHVAVIAALAKYPEAEKVVRENFLKNPARYLDAIAHCPFPYAADLVAAEMEKMYPDAEKERENRTYLEKMKELWYAAIDMESPALLRQLTRTGEIVSHVRRIYLNSRLWKTPLSADFRAALHTLLPSLPPREQTKLDFLLALEEKTPAEVYEMFSGLFAERQGILGKVKTALGSQAENQERQERQDGIFEATESFCFRPAYGWEHMDPHWYPLLLQQKRYSEYEKGLRALYREDIPHAKELWSAWEYHNLHHRIAEAEDLQRLKDYGWTDFSEVFDGGIKIWRERTFYTYDLNELNQKLLLLNLSKGKMLALLERIYQGVSKRQKSYGDAVPKLYAEIQALKDGTDPEEL